MSENVELVGRKIRLFSDERNGDICVAGERFVYTEGATKALGKFALHLNASEAGQLFALLQAANARHRWPVPEIAEPDRDRAQAGATIVDAAAGR